MKEDFSDQYNKNVKLNSPNEGDQIQCPQCQQKISLLELDNHESNCSYQSCQFCQDMYPRFLITEHQRKCQQRNFQYQSPQQSSSYNGSNQNSANQQFSHYSSPFQFSNQSYQEQSISNQNQFTPQRQQINQQVAPNQRRIFIFRSGPGGYILQSSQIGPGLQQQQQQQIRNPISMFFGNMPNSNNNVEEEFKESNDGFEQQINNNNLLQHIFQQLQGLLGSPISGNLEDLFSQNRGLDKETLQNYPVYKFKKTPNLSEELTRCAVCMCDFEDDENVKLLPCLHRFHPECIDKWLEKHSTCCICKKDFSQN